MWGPERAGAKEEIVAVSGRYTVREGSGSGHVSTSGGPGVGGGVRCFYSCNVCLGDDSLIKINHSAGVLNQKNNEEQDLCSGLRIPFSPSKGVS